MKFSARFECELRQPSCVCHCIATLLGYILRLVLSSHRLKASCLSILWHRRPADWFTHSEDMGNTGDGRERRGRPPSWMLLVPTSMNDMLFFGLTAHRVRGLSHAVEACICRPTSTSCWPKEPCLWPSWAEREGDRHLNLTRQAMLAPSPDQIWETKTRRQCRGCAPSTP